jgi:uncharacterized protein
MRIIVDICHPAHVHLYKNLIRILQQKGHFVLVTVKDIKSARTLMDNLGIQYICIGHKSDGLISKAVNQIKYDTIIAKLVRENNIDIGIGTSISLTHVSFFTRLTSFFFEDDDSAVVPFSKIVAHPFATFIVSPDVLSYERNKNKHITYAGYHELAYLHPNRFTPDPTVLHEAGLKEGEPYFILRFNAFKAHHDIGVKGLSIENKRKLINLLLKKGKVFITTERDIDQEFEEFRFRISPEKAHSFLYYATMLIGDSQTMTSEAAVLGTPAIRSNSFVGKISYLEEEEHKYELTYGFLPEQTERMFAKIDELLSMPDLKAEWQRRRLKMLEDKIDVTAFFIWLIENYPKSYEIIKNNPQYQYTFR